jgi:hypothetical protein
MHATLLMNEKVSGTVISYRETKMVPGTFSNSQQTKYGDMSLIVLADQVAVIRQQIAKAVDVTLLGEIDKNAFAFVDRRLREMEMECRTGNLKPRYMRWPELARVAEESHPDIMAPELGGKLIEVEKKYQNI